MATVQHIFGGSQDAPSVSANEYACLTGLGDVVWKDRPSVETVIPTAGKFTNFKFQVAVAPGATKQWTYYISYGATGDTSVAVGTIAGTALTSTLDTTVINVTAGMKISIVSEPSATAPTTSGAVYWSCDFIPTVSGETILMGCNNGGAGTTLYFIPFWACSTSENVEFQSQIIMPTAGTLSKLYCEVNAAPGASGKSRTYNVRLDGVETGTPGNLSTFVTNTETAKSDTTNSIAVIAGSLVSVQAVNANTPAASDGIKVSMVFTPTVAGQYCSFMTTSGIPSASAARYIHVNSYGESYVAVANITEVNSLASMATTAKVMWAAMAARAGAAGDTYKIDLCTDVAGTPTATALTTTFTDPNFAAQSVTADVAIAANDLLTIAITPGNSPTNQPRLQLGVLYYDAPTSGLLTGVSYMTT